MPKIEASATRTSEPEVGRLIVQDLGRKAYEPTLELQRRLQGEVIAARDAPAEHPRPMHLLLVEHDPPVVTISHRKSAAGHLLATPDQLAAAGVQVHATDRGGDITYHGPGQLVAYPILDLNRLHLRLHGYMRWLEQVVIDVCSGFGVNADRDRDATGVWVKTAAGPAKICAMGVRVSRWVSMHGFALNVTTNLDHFNLIVPCGLTDRPVTNLQQLLVDQCPTMEEVKHAVVERIEAGVK